MLTIPLVTLLGLAEHPGEARGLGALDPALARQLAASAARNPRSTWCITVTDELGTPSATAAPSRPGARGNPDGPKAAGPVATGPPGPAAPPLLPAPATDPGSPSPPPMTTVPLPTADTGPGT